MVQSPEVAASTEASLLHAEVQGRVHIREDPELLDSDLAHVEENFRLLARARHRPTTSSDARQSAADET